MPDRDRDPTSAAINRLSQRITEDKDQRKAIWDWAKKSESSNARSAMIRLAESEPGIPIMTEDMDRDPYLFNVENGTVNLHDGRLWPHERMETITKLAPVQFDADVFHILKRALRLRRVMPLPAPPEDPWS